MRFQYTAISTPVASSSSLVRWLCRLPLVLALAGCATAPPTPYQGTKSGRLDDGRTWAYTGTLLQGDREGKGVMQWSGGGRFEGEFTSDRPQRGTFTFANGPVYTGEVGGNYAPRGKGRMVYIDGSFRDGSFDDGNFVEGRGRINWRDSSSYEGPMKGSFKHGPDGHFRWANGDEYKGPFKLDNLDGQGQFWVAAEQRHYRQYRVSDTLLATIPRLAGGPAPTPCAAVPTGWWLFKGACPDGRLDGDVVLVNNAASLEFKATYAGGVPRGNAEQNEITSDGAQKIKGPAGGPAAFISGYIFVDGVDDKTKQGRWLHVFDGRLKASDPTTGRCKQGEDWEPCEFAGRERVDGLHLARVEENRRARAEAQRVEEERQARRERERAEEMAEERRAERRRRDEEADDRRASEAASRAALLGALGAMSARTDQMAAERLAGNARTAQLVAQAQRQQADEAAARQAAANRAAAERAEARREAEAADARRSRAAAEQAATQQAEQERRADRERRERDAERQREQERRAAADVQQRRQADEAAALVRRETAEREAAERARVAAQASATAARAPQRAAANPREADEDGCINVIGWCSTFPTGEQKGSTSILSLRNTCPFRVYGTFANGRIGGGRDAGDSGVAAGATHRWSTDDGSGKNYIRLVGSTKPSMDWVCITKFKGFEAGDMSLADKAR